MRPSLAGTVLLLFIGAVTLIDLISDWGTGSPYGHIVAELTVVLVALVGAYIIYTEEVQRLRDEAVLLRANAATLREDARRWREQAGQAVAGVSRAIDEQFAAWGLSGAEREVALLLLKGLSLKEVATVRSTTEKTVRVQAAAVYEKANISGRAELSAFFLEDLLAPPSDGLLGDRIDST